MNQTGKSLNDLSVLCQKTSIDEQTQLSQTKDTQTSEELKHMFINPYSIIDRVNQGEQFLKFLYKQNVQLDLIYSNFIKHLQKYTDHFLLSLQEHQHSLYGIYRKDLIRYMIILQDQLNDLRTKVNILQEANKNFVLFQKHFHKMTQNKSQLENLLIKHHKYVKRVFHHNQSIKYQKEFFEVYQRSSIQLKTIEQQRLLAIREQMKLVMNLTISNDHYQLFNYNNFDDLLNTWDHEHTISINNWLHFPHRTTRSQYDNSLILLNDIKEIVDEYYNHREINSNNKHTTLRRFSNQLKTIDNPLEEEFIKRIDSITSNLTHSYI